VNFIAIIFQSERVDLLGNAVDWQCMVSDGLLCISEFAQVIRRRSTAQLSSNGDAEELGFHH
jgi:hypothetical protein